MTEFVLNTNTLPEPLLRMVRSREADGVITMTPIEKAFDCTAEVFGMYSDGKLSMDRFPEQKHAEKELEF